MTPAEQRYAAALDAQERADALVEQARADLAQAEELQTMAILERRNAYAALPRATRPERSAAIHAARTGDSSR